jgi:transcription-repair coupling factor (superfamily II helicase)
MPLSIPDLSVLDSILALSDKKKRGGVEIVGPWASGKVLVAIQIAEKLGQSILYITPGRIEAEDAHEDMVTFAEDLECIHVPAWEVLPSDTMEPTDDIVAERMNGLNALIQARDSGTPVALSISVRSLLQHVINRANLEEDTIDIRVGQEHDLEKLALAFTELGYDRELMVEQRGDFSIRGGILDIFPISAELPYRIEFFGDEVEEIRHFEPETQRSVEEGDVVHVLPRSEKKLLSKQTGNLSVITEFLPEDTIIAIDEPIAVQREAQNIETQVGDSPFVARWDDVLKKLKKSFRMSLAQVAHDAADGATRFKLPMLSMAAWSGKADGFWEQLQQWDQDEFTVRLLCNNSGERRRLMELLREHGYRPGKDRFDVSIGIGRLKEGFSSVEDKLAILSEREMFGRKYVRRRRRRFQAGASITQFSDVKPGDYIVHLDHGIGRYLGLRNFPGKPNDFMSIQYRGNDVVYVPVTHIDQVQKYIGGGGNVPKMDRIGGNSWSKTKGKVKKAVRDMTQELLKLYAQRESHEGEQFSPDTHWQKEFEESFEYDETPDQIRAIVEIKKDMESPKPMERLLCGDVGFGKTEVAIRAAFKAVMDGKQVAILVPTTLLAEQHYLTFSERFADYPIKVEMLSRFRSPKEIKAIIHAMRDGEVDVVIGTHRLTSGDVQFKDLGLVILDEEQRFGVKHKERLKKLRIDVDVLTLTATPIPRTLHLSMSGVRDMSVINTAPNDRLPIHTCIEVFDEKLISEAITRELARQGQIFYLHNRVGSIDKVANMIKKLVPQARVCVGHGQMRDNGLEEVMTAFVKHEYDVLVCTTIIGSGLDIPNANTIIIDRADTFGLSELYQIRGRVGRYKHRAFAYLLIPGDRALTEEAQQRLKALEEFSTLGSGFRIAMRDLEIRGCGNILGGEQSGNIASVGYETYNQLIAEAVAELKGEPQKFVYLPSFDVSTEASIPDHYIGLESQKITLYKRITNLKTEDEVDDMYDELKDRFGEPPVPLKQLLEIMRTRVLGGLVGAQKLSVSKGAFRMLFAKQHPITQGMIDQLKVRYGDNIELSINPNPTISVQFDKAEDTVDFAKEVLRFMLGLTAGVEA